MSFSRFTQVLAKIHVSISAKQTPSICLKYNFICI
jgi:hypothetical protein